MEKKEQLYNIEAYTDEELYDILDVNNPTDRELEAKILFMIHKYEKMNSRSGKKLSTFFESVYDHFFDDEDGEETKDENATNEETELENEQEGFTNLNNLVKNTTKVPVIQQETLEKKEKEEEEEKTPPVVYTQELTYSKGILNPILKQTTKRIISIDSQYRPDKTTISTDFIVNLSEPLKDVVSLKLYSVQIPNTWYTIGKSYGSNLVYLKGRTPGINNDTHDIKLEIEAGNYKPDELVTTLNESIQTMNQIIDTDISSSAFSYNPYTSLCKFSGNLKKQYTESSYYINFPTWESPYQEETNRNKTIPSYLGFQTKTYYLNILRSPLYYSLENTNLNEDSNETFTIDDTNNYFTVIQYSNVFPYTQNSSITDISRNIAFSLENGTYSRDELLNDLNNQITTSSDFYDSYLQRKNTDENNNLYASLVSYFELKLKYSRTVMNQNLKSKTLVVFPNDTNIWLGSTSCFRFDSSFNEIDEIYSDLSPVEQSDRYTISNNPYVLLTCVEENFNNGINDLSFSMANSEEGGQGYTIQEYLNAINDGIRTTNSLNSNALNAPSSDYSFDSLTGTYPTGTYVYLKDNKFHMYLDIDISFNENLYEIDLNNSIFATGSINLQNISGTILDDLTQTYNAKANTGTRIHPGNQIICTIRPKTSTTNGNKDDISYALTLADTDDNITFSNYPALEEVINERFSTFVDPISNKNIFTGTRLTTTGIIDGVYQVDFKIKIVKKLISRSFSVQFFDPNNEDTWKSFLLLDNSMVDNAFSLNYAIPTTSSTILTNENDVAIGEITTTGDALVNARSNVAASNTLIIEAGINDTFTITAYENGVASTGKENDLTVTIAAGIYSTDYLITTLNTTLNSLTSSTVETDGMGIQLITKNGNSYVKLNINLTRIYNASDYNVVYYDEISFIECFTGSNSAQNTTWDSTIGWILGFREFTSYDLSVYNDTTTNIAIITGDTGASTSLYNYFLICLDDFNQNRLNDGLVTVTGTDTGVPLPSYAKRSEFFCDPTTGELVYNSTAGLTEKQIYAANEIANARNSNLSIGTSITASSYGRGPFATDVFGLIPVKTSNLASGAPYVEFGGTLQNQERVYFGPVNIQRVGIRLITDKGNALDLNNANWSFSLICEQLNKLEPTQ